MTAATKKGTWGPPRAASAPMAGPATKPTPKAAPSRPSRWARSEGAATSVTAAWATDTDAPEAPSMIRPSSSTQTAPARPVTSEATAVPAIDNTSTGLRPMRSDTRPQMGENTNWAAEKAVISPVAVTAVAPNCLA